MYHYCCSLPVCLSWPRRPLNQTLPSLRVQYCACSGLRGISAGNFWTLYMANPAQALGRTGFTLATTELLFSGTADVCAGRVLRSPTLLRAVLHARTRRDFSTLSGREPTLLARVHPRSSLTSWVGPEALPDVLAGQSSPGVMLRISDDLHAHSDDFQSKSTAMAVSSGVLEVVPTLSASTLGRFQPPGPSNSRFGRACQASCKPHDLQQQQPQLGWSCDLHYQTLALPSPHTLAPSDIGTYLASRSLSAQQLLLRQPEYAYAISVFRFAGLDMNIRHAQGQYAAQCLSAWRGQRTSFVQQLQGFFKAPMNTTGTATPQQQLPGVSGLVLNSMSTSPSAWVWSQVPRLATSAGRLSALPLASRCRNTSAIILELADLDWRQACTTEADFTNSTQSCHCALGLS